MSAKLAFENCCALHCGGPCARCRSTSRFLSSRTHRLSWGTGLTSDFGSFVSNGCRVGLFHEFGNAFGGTQVARLFQRVASGLLLSLQRQALFLAKTGLLAPGVTPRLDSLRHYANESKAAANGANDLFVETNKREVGSEKQSSRRGCK